MKVLSADGTKCSDFRDFNVRLHLEQKKRLIRPALPQNPVLGIQRLFPAPVRVRYVAVFITVNSGSIRNIHFTVGLSDIVG